MSLDVLVFFDQPLSQVFSLSERASEGRREILHMRSDVSPRVRSGIGKYAFHRLLGEKFDVVNRAVQGRGYRRDEAVVGLVELLERGDVKSVYGPTVDIVWRVHGAGVVGGFLPEEGD